MDAGQVQTVRRNGPTLTGRRFPTCQTCGRWFRTSAGAALHKATHPTHGPIK